MQTQFIKSATPPKFGILYFAKLLVDSAEINVIGNWKKDNQFLMCLKNERELVVDMDPGLGIEMYLQALAGRDVHENNLVTTPQNTPLHGPSGLMIMPDVDNTFIAIRAQHVTYAEHLETKKKKPDRVSIYTKSRHGYEADCSIDQFKELFQKASKGENVAIWPVNWKYHKAELNPVKFQPKTAKRITMK